MDCHEFVGLSADEAALAHLQDLKVQGRYGVRFPHILVDEDRQTAFCLAKAPSADAVEEVHRASHGYMAYQVIEVDEPTVARFMGDILEHPSGEVYVEAAFRIILFTHITGSTSLIQRLGDAGTRRTTRPCMRTSSNWRSRTCSRRSRSRSSLSTMEGNGSPSAVKQRRASGNLATVRSGSVCGSC